MTLSRSVLRFKTLSSQLLLFLRVLNQYCQDAQKASRGAVEKSEDDDRQAAGSNQQPSEARSDEQTNANPASSKRIKCREAAGRGAQRRVNYLLLKKTKTETLSKV
ncbi:unnamed protein product [Clavelina lepadiformis]|uniref:Uncharacterized protein n=1 Tax=Clavelina lepadiformis TaxID=159417 RepID=A0ABP0FWC6_CLALP